MMAPIMHPDQQVPRSNTPEASVWVLQERCHQAEECVRALLDHIEPGLLERNLYDWLLATKEVLNRV